MDPLSRLEPGTSKNARITQILTVLSADARAKLSTIARELDMPISTVFDYMKQIKQEYSFTIIKKNS